MRPTINSQAALHALLEVAPDAVVVIDGQGRFVLVNQQTSTIFGYAEEELLGQPVECLVPQALRSAHVNYRNQFLNEPKTRPMGVGLSLSGQHKDGHLIPVDISLAPLQHDGSNYVIAIVRDATESKKRQRLLEKQAKQLRASNIELEQFAYVASHDLQEPLRMVSGYTTLLKRRYHGKLDADADEFIDYAVDGVKRMQTLISDLLSYSRVTTTGKELVPVDLASVLEQVRANLTVALEESGATLTVDELPHVLGDEVQLIQLFQNLVANSIKFRTENAAPNIKVESTHDGDFWCISVRDNGIGIEPTYFEKIFEIFQSLHTRDKYPGTGIGLAICKKIVERHGGKIWLDSALGEGTSFYFTLRNVGENADGSTK